MIDRNLQYIDGEWVSGRADPIKVANPATGTQIATVAQGTAADVDRALVAARRAFPGWAATSPHQRADFLDAIRAGLAARASEIATTIATDVGTPIRIASRIQATLPQTDFATYVDILRGGAVPEEKIGNSLVVSEPAGVVAAITPWNYPLHQVAAKLAPALAAGCTVVLKPSEVAPLSVYQLFEIIDEVSLPPGVVNLVSGTGDTVGAALAGHDDVDVVSFTGSRAVGAKITAAAAPAIARVTLELGGKSANVILDDADLGTAVKVGVSNAFLNGGQTCTAWTRMLAPTQRHDEVLELARKAAEGFTVGDPLDESTKLGPLVSQTQRDRVRGYIERGIADGAQLITGGVESPPGFSAGWYVQPTVFGAVDPDSTIAQEEIFGPVLSVIPYQDEADALRIANNSAYGLHGAVWSADQDRALAFARQVRTGQIDVNGGAYNPLAPFGGYKKSGIGREMGKLAMAEYLETKSIQL